MKFVAQEKRISMIINLSKKAFGKYKYQILLLTILGIVSGILEGIGVNALIPLFSFIVGDSNHGTDMISQFIEKMFVGVGLTFRLKYLLIFICSLFIFKAIILVIFSYIRIKIMSDYEERVRAELFQKTLAAKWPYLLKQRLGYLENVLMNDVRHASLLLQQIGGLIMILTSLLIYILIALNISYYITLVTLCLGLIIFLVLKPLIHKTRKYSNEISNINKYIAHFINENILGIKTIKATLAENSILKVARQYFSDLKKKQVKILLYKSFSGQFLQPISLVFICIIFAISYKSPNFQFAVLIAVMYLIQRIFQYLQQFQLNLHHINESVPYLKHVMEFTDQSVENVEIDEGKHIFEFNDSISFNKVNFSYENSKSVLNNVDFKIKKGELVGLIGPSGSGKTTIVDLMLRLFKPSSGNIYLDDQDISEINLNEWRENIGYVSQDIFLINDTIANNIRFYNDSITNEDIVEACRMANIYDFIESIPDKLNTEIGDRGVLLSNGQRQRIIIARILARNPKLLILDEATSALDNESEIKIQKVIENLKGKMTVFVIAHRLSTVINSDKLLVLEGGKIIEQGSPKELLENKKSYFYKVFNIRK